MVNPFRWLRENRQRNLDAYAASQPSPQTIAARSLARHGAKKRSEAYEVKRREVVDRMREAQGKPRWDWSEA